MNPVQERMMRLSDQESLRIIEESRSAVTIGVCKIEGIPTVLYGFNERCHGGALGFLEGRTIERATVLAQEAGAPLVCLGASAGADLTQGQASLLAASKVFSSCHRLTVPHLFLAYGTCVGAGAYLSNLSDIVFALEDKAHFCITGPKIVKASIFETSTLDSLGSATGYATIGGCHRVFNTEDAMVSKARETIKWFKRPRRVAEKGKLLLAEDASMDAIIDDLLDSGYRLRLWEDWAQNAETLFGTIDGIRVAIVCNQPSVAGGVIDRDAALKMAAFYRLAEKFHIPIITLADTPGFLPGSRSEGEGILRAGSALISAYLNHSAPKVSVAVGRVLGGAYMAMGTKAMGACAHFALKSAEIGVMGADLASKITAMKSSYFSEYHRMQLSPEAALKIGLIDDIVGTSELRSRITEVIL